MTFDGRLLGGVSVLAAVVETGNFVRAAEALGLTPSGVSRAVARLEARVGVVCSTGRRAQCRSPTKVAASMPRWHLCWQAWKKRRPKRRVPPRRCKAGSG